ncbi:hypothetical protein B5M09_003463 [Aphanomyces astaci]|uniref:RWD domain-containing protein n=1 Tax=Aphanomyces astaci TaxID=112090 RepID=A0A3R7ZEH6_APHAT|nr:hypothetical protein B5M09_003463 [Aphanomyces astaci]
MSTPLREPKAHSPTSVLALTSNAQQTTMSAPAQNDELEALQAIYGSDAVHYTILKQLQQLQVLVTLKDSITFEFTLSIMYPEDQQCPTVSFPYISSKFTGSEAVLRDIMCTAASGSLAYGQVCLFSMIEAATEHLQDHKEVALSNDENAGTSPQKPKPPHPLKQRPRHPLVPKKQIKSTEAPLSPTETAHKGNSMRTATDVIHRIMWDDQINQHEVVVGYLDRFLGIMERPITSFNWGDLSTLSHTETAIPKHRIQYFKWKGNIVWDKRCRLDRVFGSSGGAPPVSFDSASPLSGSTSTSGGVYRPPELAPYFSPFYPNSDRPNAFFCIRITNPAVVDACAASQHELMTIDPRLRLHPSAFIPVTKLHCTLVMLRLKNVQEMAIAHRLLLEAQGLIEATFASSSLTLSGVSTFSNRVVHAQVLCPALTQVAGLLRRRVQLAGISTVGNRDPFEAHVTLCKLTREMNKSIPSITYTSHQMLGSQAVTEIDLCATGGLLDPDGFYVRLVPTLVLRQDQVATTTRESLPPLSPRSMVILRGVPGSGKSTTSRSIAALCAANGWSVRVCSADSCFDQSGGYKFDKSKLPLAHAQCQHEVQDAMKSTVDVVVVDNTNMDARHVHAYVADGRAAGYKVHVWELDASHNAAACVRRSVHDIPLDYNKQLEPVGDVDHICVTKLPVQGLLPPIMSSLKLPSVTYAAVFLDDQSKKRLKTHVAPLHANMIMDHVTIAYQPSEAMLKTLHVGATVSFEASAAAANAFVQAVVVTSPSVGGGVWDNDGSPPHVTVSVAPGSSAKASHHLLASTHAIPLPFPIPLSGVVGFFSDLHRRLTSLAEVVQCGEIASSSCIRGSTLSLPPTVTSLFVFDFDLTLIRPPPRRHGMQALTPQEASTIGNDWFKSPLSLHPTQKLVPLPALGELKRVLGATAARGVVLTARHTSLEANIRDVLGIYGVSPDAVVGKPDHLIADVAGQTQDSQVAARTKENIAFKLDILTSWLESSAALERVVVYEDDDEILAAMYAWAGTWSARKTALAIEIVDAKSMYLGKPYTVLQWLKNLDRVPTLDFSQRVHSVLTDIAMWTRAEDVRPFGSFALHRATDLDVLVALDDDESAVEAVARVAATMRREGLTDVYESGSSRCPLLKARWTFPDAPPLEVDLVFVHKTALTVYDNGSPSAVEAWWSSSNPDERALLGLATLHSVRAKVANSSVSIDVFGRCVDVIVTQLQAKHLHGPQYNGVPTFKISALVAAFCQTQTAPSLPLKDVVKGFYASQPVLDVTNIHIGPHMQACVRLALEEGRDICCSAEASFPSSGSLTRLVQRRSACVDTSHIVSLAVTYTSSLSFSSWTLTHWFNWSLAKSWRDLWHAHAIEVDPMLAAAGMARTFGVLGDVDIVVAHLQKYAAQLAMDSLGKIQVSVVLPPVSVSNELGSSSPSVPAPSTPHDEGHHVLMKFPRTKHLLPTAGISRDDLVFDPLDASAFLRTPIVCQEKVDGANLGLFLSPDFQVVAQNRSHYTTSETAPQFKGLDVWIQVHQFELCELLSPPGRYVLYGEWLYAQHSIAYTNLPSYFLAFDMYDRELECFWSVERLQQALDETSIHMVPTVFTGTYSSMEQLKTLLETKSQFYDGVVEGVVIRKEANQQLHAKAKLVRDDFIQHIDKHWTTKGVVKNHLRFF